MADPVYALILVALALALLAATLMPAPQRPAEDDATVGLTLLAAGCVAALAMGVLAILALPVASAVLGVIAWLLVMPCVWLARGPQGADGWADEEEDDDGDGGSPSPDAPLAPPAPDARLPGLQPAATPAPAVTWTPAPRQHVMATAARVQRLLAERAAERLLAAQEVERILAAAALAAAQDEAVESAPAPVFVTTPVLAPAPPSAHKPAPPRLRPAPRVRADHRSIAHVLAAVAHARTRRRGAKHAERPTAGRL